MNIEILYPYALYIGTPVLFLSTIYRYLYYKKPIYLYSSLKHIAKPSSKNWQEFVLFLLRFLGLLFLILAASRLRVPDARSKIAVNGIDIMLALDVSGSMQNNGQDTAKSKFDIAKEEAIKFIEKRYDDSIGLALFGNYAVSRCPLTQDKNALKNLILDVQIGQIDPDGTVLANALLIAINRLKYSNAKSKIIILLTDGNPSYNDKQPEIAVDLARSLNIKIYTIGIGSDKPSYIYNMFGTPIALVHGINTNLLENISKNTGGSFFLAKDPKELEEIYNQIDQLEKTEYQAPVYSKYFEYFMLFLWISVFLLILEMLLSTLFWPALA